MTNPAKYRNRLQFEELSKHQNEDGYWIEEWIDSDLGKVYAQIRNIRGKEFIMAGAKQVKVSARINIRYRKDIEDKYFALSERLRLTFGKRIFEIVYINNLEERNTELELIVNEVR